MKIDRRRFLGGMSAALLGGVVTAAPVPRWKPLGRRKAAVDVKGTARNLIFILLDGGPSHVDTFDLKVGRWTPDLLGAENLGGGLMWPSGLMPKLSKMSDQFSIVRSVSAVEAVHERAVYHLVTAHRHNPALVGEIPLFASVLSYKLEALRREFDTLPTVMTVGQLPASNGFLSVDHQGLKLAEYGGIEDLFHELGEGGEDPRLGLLDGLLADMERRYDARADHLRYQRQARKMMGDAELQSLIGTDLGGNQNVDGPGAMFIRQCDAAVRVIGANKGAHVFSMVLNGWDHHDNIYDAGNLFFSLPAQCGAFDDGFSYLINELSALPGQNGAESLLDETLIVAAGEFGRTTGALNSQSGRDHFPYVTSAVLAGGGVQQGRIIGGSNATGDAIVDAGWSHGRYITINDLVATMYSAMGVDWTERFEDTPSGRVFEIVDSSLTGEIHHIDTLFT